MFYVIRTNINVCDKHANVLYLCVRVYLTNIQRSTAMLSQNDYVWKMVGMPRMDGHYRSTCVTWDFVIVTELLSRSIVEAQSVPLYPSRSRENSGSRVRYRLVPLWIFLWDSNFLRRFFRSEISSHKVIFSPRNYNQRSRSKFRATLNVFCNVQSF